MRLGSSPWSATPSEGLSALRRIGGQERVRSAPRSGPMSAFVPVHLSPRRIPPAAYRPRRIPAPRIPAPSGLPDFSDMSAVCVPKRPDSPPLLRHVRVVDTLRRTGRQERVRFAPRVQPDVGVRSCPLVRPPHTAPSTHTGADSGLPRLLRHVCRMCAETARTPPTTQTCPGCRHCSGQTDRNESGFRPVQARCPAFVPVQCPPRRIPPPPHTGADSGLPDFSDMSAVCVPKRPERRHYSDMSGLLTPGAHTGSWGAVLPGENRVAPRL